MNPNNPTKRNFLESIQWKLCGGQPTAEQLVKYDLRIIEQEVSNWYDRACLEIFFNTKGADLSLFDNWTYPFKATIEYDNDRKEFYSDIPAGLIPIPNFISLREVRPLKSQFGALTIIRQESVRDIMDSISGQVNDEIMCYAEATKVFYINYNQDFDDVLMKLVCSFINIDWETNISIPISNKGNISDMVVQSMMMIEQKPLDKKTDNA